MKNNKMQTKDIPDRPILEFIEPWTNRGRWCCLYAGDTEFENSVANAMPAGLPYKLMLGKMRQLIHRGLVSGCGCGCRGDFEITDKGREWLDLVKHGVDIHSEMIRMRKIKESRASNESSGG